MGCTEQPGVIAAAAPGDSLLVTAAAGRVGHLAVRDSARGEAIAADLLERGLAYVNRVVGEDPRLPFGGIKGSGYGREMSGYDIKGFVNIKTVYVA